jgi:hypothetical protein
MADIILSIIVFLCSLVSAAFGWLRWKYPPDEELAVHDSEYGNMWKNIYPYVLMVLGGLGILVSLILFFVVIF